MSNKQIISKKLAQKQMPTYQSGTPLYTPKQVYAIEQSWFEDGHDSYGLMQQAAWQIASWINGWINGWVNQASALRVDDSQGQCFTASKYGMTTQSCSVIYVWVGGGNNGGDGWLVASYLQQMHMDVTVVEVGVASTEDAKRAKQEALSHGVKVLEFDKLLAGTHYPAYADMDKIESNPIYRADMYIDALFGIGLDRKPTGTYERAIECMNVFATYHKCLAPRLSLASMIAIDVPSGVNARTGEVVDGCAVRATLTLCLVARKIGLHLKDSQDHVGWVVDIPLIPSVLGRPPQARLLSRAKGMPKRPSNTHKGSFGHVLIVGGNQVAGSQGMGGAAMLAASSAFAMGAGKLTVACHTSFHGSLIGSLPNAMSMDLHDKEGVGALMTHCNVLAIGMGLGRDEISQALFMYYVQAAMHQGLDIIIDADGLYHLATCAHTSSSSGQLGEQLHQQLCQQLLNYAQSHQVWYTPHSGEAARLLGMSVDAVESDRIHAIGELQSRFGGSWLLKGIGSLITEPEINQDITHANSNEKYKATNTASDNIADDKVNHQLSEQVNCYVCGAGNAGMATAGMGDVLSGVAAGLLAQRQVLHDRCCLSQAVMIHAMAGDKLVEEVGEYALQAQDMPEAIASVMGDLVYQSLVY